PKESFFTATTVAFSIRLSGRTFRNTAPGSRFSCRRLSFPNQLPSLPSIVMTLSSGAIVMPGPKIARRVLIILKSHNRFRRLDAFLPPGRGPGHALSPQQGAEAGAHGDLALAAIAFVIRLDLVRPVEIVDHQAAG